MYSGLVGGLPFVARMALLSCVGRLAFVVCAFGAFLVLFLLKLRYKETQSGVTKIRSGWACIGNLKLDQDSIEGTHPRETPAYQRRPTTLHEVQGSNPPQSGHYTYS